MSNLEKVIYTAKVHTTGGREGQSASDDGALDVRLGRPGAGNGTTNPEQLFAAGYSACFLGAMKHVAGQKQVALPDDASIDAAVDLGPSGKGFAIAVKMTIHLPGVDRAVAQDLVDTAHREVYPYSHATRGNVDVQLTLA